MNRTATLSTMRAAIDRYNLLTHPFYRAWSAGTLPAGALATYAREYGAFIGVLNRGWTTLDEPGGAAIERTHAALWSDFARALETTVASVPGLTAVRALVEEATRSFAAAAESAGALYAFEVQQPATAQSKLEGLDTHYASLSPSARPYFAAHAAETAEEALLADKLAAMTDVERERAAAACGRMCKALWDALSDIHAGSC